MKRIVMFENRDGELCDFFDAERFSKWEQGALGWEKTDTVGFEKLRPTTLAQTRRQAEELVPLIKDTHVLVGGSITGVPFTVFDTAGFHIFQIISSDYEMFKLFDEIIVEVEDEETARSAA